MLVISPAKVLKTKMLFRWAHIKNTRVVHFLTNIISGTNSRAIYFKVSTVALLPYLIPVHVNIFLKDFKTVSSTNVLIFTFDAIFILFEFIEWCARKINFAYLSHVCLRIKNENEVVALLT